jgi:hypothetical protein
MISQKNRIVKGWFTIVNTYSKEEHSFVYEEISYNDFYDLIDELEYLGYMVTDIGTEE